MTTTAQYSGQIRLAARVVGRKMGVDFGGSSKELRVLVRVVAGTFAVLIKLLVDKGLLTDAEIAAALTASAGDPYTDEPVDPPTDLPPPPVQPDPPVVP